MVILLTVPAYNIENGGTASYSFESQPTNGVICHQLYDYGQCGTVKLDLKGIDTITRVIEKIKRLNPNPTEAQREELSKAASELIGNFALTLVKTMDDAVKANIDPLSEMIVASAGYGDAVFKDRIARANAQYQLENGGYGSAEEQMMSQDVGLTDMQFLKEAMEFNSNAVNTTEIKYDPFNRVQSHYLYKTGGLSYFVATSEEFKKGIKENMSTLTKMMNDSIAGEGLKISTDIEKKFLSYGWAGAAFFSLQQNYEKEAPSLANLSPVISEVNFASILSRQASNENKFILDCSVAAEDSRLKNS